MTTRTAFANGEAIILLKGNFLSFLRVGVNKARHWLGIVQKQSRLRHPTFQRIFGRAEEERDGLNLRWVAA
jgi:hypothetical protein